MIRASGSGQAVGFILLILIALYAAYFTAHIKVANEHVELTRAAAHVPFSGNVGETVICAYGQFWNIECSADERAAALNLSIRYLCPAYLASQKMECIDRNMVGIAAILTFIAGVLAATGAVTESRRLQDRRSAASAILRYGICAAASLLLLRQLSGVVLPTIWIGSLNEQIIATQAILAFTGNVIGYGLLIALAAIGLVGAVASAAALAQH